VVELGALALPLLEDQIDAVALGHGVYGSGLLLPENLLPRKIYPKMRSMFTKRIPTIRRRRSPQPQPRMRWYS
jgi:hypothetical protein